MRRHAAGVSAATRWIGRSARPGRIVANGFFMGNSLSDSKDLLIPFISNDPLSLAANFLIARDPGTIVKVTGVS